MQPHVKQNAFDGDYILWSASDYSRMLLIDAVNYASESWVGSVEILIRLEFSNSTCITKYVQDINEHNQEFETIWYSVV